VLQPSAMRGFALAILVLGSAVAAAAQTEPDLAITARVTAREVRFAEVPNVRVTVTGSVNGREAITVSRTDRQNLPETVQPYVTYRDIGILLTITSTLPDIEQILDDALAPETPPAPPKR
jgi:hypothetical protein